MQVPYKEQSASNVVHLSLYWNMLSFSFTIVECSLDISFRVAMQHTLELKSISFECLDISFRMAMQHTSPLKKGEIERRLFIPN